MSVRSAVGLGKLAPSGIFVAEPLAVCLHAVARAGNIFAKLCAFCVFIED